MRTWHRLAGILAICLLCSVLAFAQDEQEPAEAQEQAPADTAAVALSPEDSLRQAAQDSLDALLADAERVSGEISGIWSPGRRYLVTETITIVAGDSLLIPASAEIYMAPPADGRNKVLINCLGYLEIAGTSEQKVKIRSARMFGPERIWGGIIYVGNLSEGRVEHTTIQHAEIGVQARRGLVAETPAGTDTSVAQTAEREHIMQRATGPITIRDCEIDSATFNGIVLVGVDSTVKVLNNRVFDCSSGIACEDSASPIISDNTILNSYSTGIILSANSNPTIQRCTIIGATTAGIICANQSNPTIDRCVIAKSGMGISTTASNPVVTRCTIADNEFSGIIAYVGAEPMLTDCNIRDNGLCAIDNRSRGTIRADRCWWGFIIVQDGEGPVVRTDGYAPFLDGPTRRFLNQPVDDEASGRILANDPLHSPSIEAPGTPSTAESLTLCQDRGMLQEITGTVSHGDSIFIRLVARDESPYLEDQAPIIITTSTGDPEGVQQVLRETGVSTGTYEGSIVASLVPGDPNIVVQVQNGDVIRVQTGTLPPIAREVTFVSRPPIIRRMRINDDIRGIRLIEPTPTFSWLYWDNENDPQAAIQIEMGTDPEWQTPAFWSHEETGGISEYSYNSGELQKGRTYYVRIRANDSYNWGPWKQSNFHMNLPPPTPEPAFPDHGDVVRSPTGNRVMAAQNVQDSDGDAVQLIFDAYYYDSTFSDARKRIGIRNEVFPPISQDTDRDFTYWHPMPNLIENTYIWWRVKATDGLEESEWSTPRKFFLDTYDDVITPFNLIRPQPEWTLDTTRSTRPRFEWEHTYDPDAGQEITFILRYGRTPTLDPSHPSVEVVRMPPRNEQTQYYMLPPFEELEDNTPYWWTVDVEQNGSVVLRPNTVNDPPRPIWPFIVDTGNDPPYIYSEVIPEIVIAEDTPYRLVLIDSVDVNTRRGYPAIRDNDDPLDDLSLEVQRSQHVSTTVTSRPGEKIITLTPEADWFGGPETILLTVRDVREKMGQGQFTVRVSPVNDTPTLAGIPDHTVAEDTDIRIDLKPFVSDIDNTDASMIWSARYNRNKVRVRISRGVATVRGAPNFNGGPVPIQFTSRDPSGQSASTIANIRITPVNDRPEVSQIPVTTFEEDGSATLNLDLYADDPDNTDRQLVWTAEPDEPLRVQINEQTRRAVISAPENWGGGQRRVAFTVRDPAGLLNRVIATVNVESVNDNPVIADIPPQQFNEDEELILELDPFVTDVDNAKRDIRWRVQNPRHVRAVVDQNTRRLRITAPTNWYGRPEEVTVTATDPGGLSATETFTVRVTSVPESPVFTEIPAITINEDEQRVIRLDRYLSDPDHENSQLTLSVTAPRHVQVQLDRQSRHLTISAPQNWNGGPETVSVEAVDPDNERARISFPVTFTAVNDPPVLATIPGIETNEDEPTSLSLVNFVSDPDNQKPEITWTVAGQRRIQVEVVEGVATLTPATNWNGTEQLTITARDPLGLTATQRVSATINAVNDAPVLTDIPEVTFPEDESETIRLFPFVEDVDNTDAQMRWRVSGNRHVSVRIGENGRARFSAEQDWNGGEVVNLTVTDPGGLSDTKTVMVTVGPVNDLPQISDIPPVTIEEDQRTTVNLSQFVTDPDNDPATMRWTATGGENVNVTVSRGTASISAGQNWNGTENITMTVTDPGGLSNRKIMRITVTAINDGPVLSTLRSVALNEDETATLNLNEFVADPDDEDSRLAWTVAGNTKVRVAVVNGVATFSAEENWNGEEALTITVNDPGGLRASRPLSVRVRPVNDAPQLRDIPLVVLSEDGSTTLALRQFVTDPDNSAVQMTWTLGDAQNLTTTLTADARVTFNAAANYNGEQRITVTVADPEGATTTKSIQVRVMPVNDPPVLRGFPPVQFNEDGSTTLDLKEYIDDVDNTKAEINWQVSGETHVSVRIARGVAAFSAAENWNGRELVTVTASDPDGSTAESTTWVSVTPVNDPPVLQAVPAQTAPEDEPIEVALNDYVADPDNEASQMTWSITGGQHITAVVHGGTATLTPAENWSGRERLTVTVRDPDGLEATRAFNATITTVNDPPVLRTFPTVTFAEDGNTVVNLSENVEDPDNTPAQMRWSFSETQNVTVQVTGQRARFSANANWNGQESVVLTVTDPAGETASTAMSIIVSPVNDPPVLQSIPAVTFAEDGAGQVDLASYVSDIDGDAVSWSASSQNTNLRPNMTGSVLNITAAPNWSGGPGRITITATDAAGGSDSKAVSVTVTPVNDPPSIGSIPAVRFAEDGSTSLNTVEYLSDPDDAVARLTVSISGGQNITGAASGTTIRFSASANWSGSEEMTITVRDPGGLEASTSVNVTVEPVNDGPQARAIPGITMEREETKTVNLAPYAQDIEGDALQWRVSSGSRGLSTRIRGSLLDITSLRSTTAGQHTLNLTVRDAGGAEAQTSIQVTVNVPPPPPPPDTLRSEQNETPAPERRNSPR